MMDDPRSRSFSAAAVNYDSVTPVHREIASKLFAELQNYVSNPRAVLEIGPGTGHLTCELVKQYRPQLLELIDISHAMLHSAAAKIKPYIQPETKCSYIHYDAETFPYKGPYNLIASSSAFQWIKDLQTLVQKLIGTLETGGTLAFSLFGNETLQELYKSFQEVTGRPLPERVKFYSKEQIPEITGKAHSVKIISGSMTSEYESPAHLLKSFRRMGASLTPYNQDKKISKKEYLKWCHHYTDNYGTVNEKAVIATWHWHLVIISK